MFSLQQGQVINGTRSNYQVIQKIGQGAISEVYQGINTVTTDLVAIKIMNKIRCIDNQPNIYFQSEIEIAQSLQNMEDKCANIANIIEVIPYNQQQSYLIISEFCQFGDLYQNLVANKGLLNDKLKLIYCISICEGVVFLHQKKIIHRDLKPDNILIGYQNNQFRLKITDFGLCKQNKDLYQSFVGTVIYMAPEILKNQIYSQKVDIWSLGCIMDEIVREEVIFDGDTMNNIIQSIINFKEYNYKHFMSKIISKCLSANPDDRYNANELLTELTQLLSEMDSKEIQERDNNIQEQNDKRNYQKEDIDLNSLIQFPLQSQIRLINSNLNMNDQNILKDTKSYIQEISQAKSRLFKLYDKNNNSNINQNFQNQVQLGVEQQQVVQNKSNQINGNQSFNQDSQIYFNDFSELDKAFKIDDDNDNYQNNQQDNNLLLIAQGTNKAQQNNCKENLNNNKEQMHSKNLQQSQLSNQQQQFLSIQQNQINQSIQNLNDDGQKNEFQQTKNNQMCTQTGQINYNSNQISYSLLKQQEFTTKIDNYMQDQIQDWRNDQKQQDYQIQQLANQINNFDISSNQFQQQSNNQSVQEEFKSNQQANKMGQLVQIPLQQQENQGLNNYYYSQQQDLVQNCYQKQEQLNNFNPQQIQPNYYQQYNMGTFGDQQNNQMYLNNSPAIINNSNNLTNNYQYNYQLNNQYLEGNQKNENYQTCQNNYIEIINNNHVQQKQQFDTPQYFSYNQLQIQSNQQSQFQNQQNNFPIYQQQVYQSDNYNNQNFNNVPLNYQCQNDGKIQFQQAQFQFQNYTQNQQNNNHCQYEINNFKDQNNIIQNNLNNQNHNYYQNNNNNNSVNNNNNNCANTNNNNDFNNNNHHHHHQFIMNQNNNINDNNLPYNQSQLGQNNNDEEQNQQKGQIKNKSEIFNQLGNEQIIDDKEVQNLKEKLELKQIKFSNNSYQNQQKEDISIDNYMQQSEVFLKKAFNYYKNINQSQQQQQNNLNQKQDSSEAAYQKNTFQLERENQINKFFDYRLNNFIPDFKFLAYQNYFSTEICKPYEQQSLDQRQDILDYRKKELQFKISKTQMIYQSQNTKNFYINLVKYLILMSFIIDYETQQDVFLIDHLINIMTTKINYQKLIKQVQVIERDTYQQDILIKNINHFIDLLFHISQTESSQIKILIFDYALKNKQFYTTTFEIIGEHLFLFLDEDISKLELQTLSNSQFQNRQEFEVFSQNLEILRKLCIAICNDGEACILFNKSQYEILRELQQKNKEYQLDFY